MLPIEAYLPRLQLTVRGLSNFKEGTPSVLGFHGWLDNANSLVPLVKNLSDENIMIFDFPGHGLSDHVHSSNLPQFHDYVYVLAELLEVLKIDQVILIGHSMGGAASSLFAGTFPHRVSKFIMIESIGPLATKEEDAPETMAKAINRWLGTKPSNPTYKSKADAVETRQKAGDLDYKIAEFLADRGTRQTDNGWQWTHDPKLKLPSPKLFSEEQVQNYLGKIRCPTLLIRGRQSYLMKSKTVESRMATIQSLRSEVLDGGHHVHMEKPRQSAEIIKSFLAETLYSSD